MLKRPKSKDQLLGKKQEPSEPRYSPLNPNVLIVPARGPRKTPFDPNPDGASERDVILGRVRTYLAEHNVPYVPLAIEEDIQASYEDDTLEEFRGVVRGWVRALVEAA